MIRSFVLFILFLSVPGLVAGVNVGIGQVYFSTGTFDLNSEMNQALIDFVNSATKSIRVANFSFSDDDPAGQSLVDALVTQKGNGLTVEVVLDLANNSGSGAATVAALQAAGIPVKFDAEAGDPEMHNKFIVIDSDEGDKNNGKVALGSANFNDPQFSSDNNNLLIIDQSSELAFNYSKEFDQMFDDGKFHGNKVDVKPKTEFTVGQIKIKNYFGPQDRIIDRMIEEVDRAVTRVYFAVFTFGNSDLSNAIINAAARGVEVKGVFDRDQTLFLNSQQNIFNAMLGQQNIEVELSSNGNGIMHHKFMIIDNTIVTGSANFTTAANEENDENDVFVVGDTVLNDQFILEFANLFSGFVDTSGIIVPGSEGVASADAPVDISPTVNYPNPFVWSPGSEVVIATADRNQVHKVEIYSLRGRLIRVLTLPATSSKRSIEWDGRDASGNVVASGVYPYRLYVKEHVIPLIGKLTFIK